MVESIAIPPQQLDRIFHALSDETRRAILRLLSRAEHTVGAIAEQFPISLAAVSKHLQVLDSAALISRRRDGRSQIVRLNAQSLRPAEAWLAYYETFWTQQIDALQNYLENNQGESDAATH
jgi:DNA-binding transcriptional ArsR family regulator